MMNPKKALRTITTMSCVVTVIHWMIHLMQKGVAPKPKREARLGYSRRSAGDFDRRELTCRSVIEKVIRPWVDKCPHWKKKLSVDIAIFQEDYFEGYARRDDQCIYFPPTFNKQATFLSAFVDSFIMLREAYVKKNGRQMTIEKQLEFLLPIIFSSSAQTYRTVLREWANNDTILAMSRIQ